MNISEIDDRIMKYVPKSKQQAIRACWHDSDGYWIELHDGYNADRMDWHCHTIHEDTIAELRYQIAGIGIDKEYWEELKMPESNATESRIYQHDDGIASMMLELEKQDRFTSIFYVLDHDYNGNRQYLVAINPTIDEERGTVDWRRGSLCEGYSDAVNTQVAFEIAQRKHHYSKVYSTISKSISASMYELYHYDLNAAYKACLEEHTAEDIATAMALYIKDHSWDGRISKANKEWASNQLSGTLDDKIDHVSSITTHPTLLDGFADVLKKEREKVFIDTNDQKVVITIPDLGKYDITGNTLIVRGKSTYEYDEYHESTLTDIEIKIERTKYEGGDDLCVSFQKNYKDIDDPDISFYPVNEPDKIHSLEQRLENTFAFLTNVEITCENSDYIRLKELINDWCLSEFEQPADFSDIRHVNIAYTTDPDTEETIQVYADLDKLCILKLYDDVPVSETYYENAYDMGDVFLNLEFDEIVALTDKEEEKARKIDSDKASHSSFLPPIIKNVLDDEKSEEEIIYSTADNGRK